ncbi:uncharacterized protein LOC134686013 [Mytilus trossulus]|uniref:uncharacterized protein LOC134686013 n=1 Tax=Mytilus trossulus TaxID=6551 RepID=UPI003003AE8C
MSDVGSVASMSSTRTQVINRRNSVDSLPGVEAYLRRRRGSTSQIFAPSDLNDLEQYVNKKRRASVGLIQLSEKGDIFRESSSLSLGRRQYSSTGPLWEQEVAHGQKEDDAATIKKTRRRKSNVQDKKSLYSITGENIAGKDMQFLDKPAIGESATSNNNIEQKVEREYILKAHLRDNSHAKFENAIMRHFYKAPAPKAHPGYGMPRPETREANPFKLMMADLQRDPSIVQVNSYPSLSNPKKCQIGNDFCEVLGPASCSTCIETTNRYIADELQRIMFPKIDMNRVRLVKPKLARVMKHGHMFQVRKKKMGDLDYPEELVTSLRRQETQISHLTKSAVNPFSRSSSRSKRSSHTNRKTISRDLPNINEDRSKLKPLELK